MHRSRFMFSLKETIFNNLYLDDPSSQITKISRAPTELPVKGIREQIYSPVNVEYQTTELSSGVRVLTESVGVPSNVHLGIFLDVGSRN